jgi:hypothetical protein
VYSHFGPGKFPDNWWTVFTCVVVYCVINLVLTIFGHIKEGSSFLITHPKPVSRQLHLWLAAALMPALQDGTVPFCCGACSCLRLSAA